jgi:hypothetical protein
MSYSFNWPTRGGFACAAWGASVQLQGVLQRIQCKAGETADEGSVQADVLKIPADVEFDDRDHLVDVPRSDLVSDGASHLSLMRLDERLKNLHNADIDVRANLRLLSQLASEIGEKSS